MGESAATADRNFDPRQCIFCNVDNDDLEQNLDHMYKKHGLFIPDKNYLIVDLEALVDYFHLVVFGYSECLYCGLQRRSPQAVQQHMIGKGHCKIDISSEESEYRDFYDFGPSSDNSADDDIANEGGKPSKQTKDLSFDPDEMTIRLASGKTLSHRSSDKARLHKYKPRRAALIATDESGPSEHKDRGPLPKAGPVAARSGTSGALTRSTKREAVFEKQLATMRAEDRRALAHLPAPQQRVLLAKAKAQVERARKEENEMKLKIQLKANRSIKK